MNAQSLITPTPPFETQNFNAIDILGYGNNNLYPQTLIGIVQCSESGSTCLARYVKFIQGNGFNDTSFSDMEINKDGNTVDDLLSLTANDLGAFGGVALHVNYDINANIVEVNHIPFENTRLTIPNDNGYIEKIAVFPNWGGTVKRKNVTLRPTVENIDYIHRFNPDKNVVLSQIEAAGGIDIYKGQILWFSSRGKNEYPVAIYDSVVTLMSTEEGLGNVSYRFVRNGLHPSKVVAFKKGLDTSSSNNDDNDTQDDIIEERRQLDEYNQSIEKTFNSLQTDVNSSSIGVLYIDSDADIPVVIDLTGENYDKSFTVTTETTCEKIYAVFSQEVWHRMRKGSVGFSSDILQDAYDVTSSMTGTERRAISRMFKKIFMYWHEPITENKTFDIEPLVYITTKNNGNS